MRTPTGTSDSPAEGIGDILPGEAAVHIPAGEGLVGSIVEQTYLSMCGLMTDASGT